MVAISYLDARRPLHPLHAILLSIPLPLFIGALICDVAYSRTWHVQWGNFSSWLIAGALADDTWVYPGHGRDTTLGAERPYLGEWRERGW